MRGDGAEQIRRSSSRRSDFTNSHVYDFLGFTFAYCYVYY